MYISTIGLDISKSVFHLHGVDSVGEVALRRKLRRGEVLNFFAKLSPCVVALEACATSHYWGRALSALGHEVRLIPPSYVGAYVKRGKNDAVDAAAIAEAASRPSMHLVALKSEAQQAMLSAHRVRSMLVRQRTMLINLLRAQLAEFGLVSAKGRDGLSRLVALVREPADERLPAVARTMLREPVAAIEGLERQLRRIDKAMVAGVRENAAARRLTTIPGIGVITASALVATVGDPQRFLNGRHFAAWLGLTPREHTTGGKPRLGRISKMGDRYLRSLLVLGATSRLKRIEHTDTPLDRWARKLVEHKPKRLATVAMANKTARIAWALMASGQPYRPERAAA